MKKTTCIFYSFDELRSLLRRSCFTQGERFDVEIVDHYFWRIIFYDPTLDESIDDPSISDFDALPVFSKLLGMRLANTHVSHDGVWFEGEPELPKRTTRGKKRP